MKKTLIAPLVILAAGAGAAPYFIGSQAEQHFDQYHAQLQEEMVYPQVEVEAGEFERGWLASRASTRIRFAPPNKPSETLEFELVHHIDQIPSLAQGAMATVESTLVLPPEIAGELEQYLQGEPLLSANTLIKFNGSEVSHFSSPAYSGPLEGDDAVQVEWQGLSGTATRDGQQRVSVSMEGPLLEINADDGKLEMRALNYQTQLEQGAHDLWYGTAEASLEGFQFRETGSAATRLAQVHFTSEQRENGPLVDINSQLSFDSAAVEGFELTNGHYDIAYNNIDGASLSRINESMKEMLRSQPENPELALQAMLPHLFSALGQKPELAVRKLTVDTPMGNVSGDMQIVLTEAIDQSIMQQPEQLMQMLNADLSASLPKPMLEALVRSNMRSTVTRMAQMQEQQLSPEELNQLVDDATQRQIDGLLTQKLLVTDNDAYSTKVHYTPGKLVINDQDATPMLNGMM
ncbi:MAG: YdgA family protein [Pseudomonadota bacterium]